MPCQDDNHIWDIFWIENKTTFESRLSKEYLKENSDLGSISICRICNRISILDKIWDLIKLIEPIQPKD